MIELLRWFCALSPMLLDFNLKKAIAATALLIECEGGTGDLFYLVKELYYADRTALIRWGKSVTGDSLACMAKGPIVSGIYNLLKGRGDEQDQIEWNDVIQKSGEFSYVLRKHPDEGMLSVRETEVLVEAYRTIKAIRGSIPDWLGGWPRSLRFFCWRYPEWGCPTSRAFRDVGITAVIPATPCSREEIRPIFPPRKSPIFCGLAASSTAPQPRSLESYALDDTC